MRTSSRETASDLDNPDGVFLCHIHLNRIPLSCFL